MIFNNGLRRSAEPYSSVDELVLPMDAEGRFQRAPGQPYGPTEPVWSYRSADPEEFYSFFISGAERLPNGNTLICSGAQGRFFEVTPEGRIVWEYWNPYGGEEGAPGNNMGIDPKAVFRVERLAPDHPGLAGRL